MTMPVSLSRMWGIRYSMKFIKRVLMKDLLLN